MTESLPPSGQPPFAGSATALPDLPASLPFSLYDAVFAWAPVGLVILGTDRRYLRLNDALATMIGVDAAEVVGRRVDDVLPELWAELRPHFERVVSSGEPVEFEVEGGAPAGDEARRHWLMHYYPLFGEQGHVSAVAGVVLDRTTDQRTRERLAIREREQAATARLGQRALAARDGAAFMREVVETVADVLDVEFAKILERMPGDEELLLRAGVGWRDGLVGRATVSADRRSQAGYTLEQDDLVIVNDLAAETRLSGPPLLVEHGVVSGMSVPIPGGDGPYGVLGAHSTERHRFTRDDMNFLVSIASIVAMHVEQQRADEGQEFLASTSELLSRALERDDTLTRLAARAVIAFADYCLIYLVAEHGAARAAAAARSGIEPAEWDRPPDAASAVEALCTTTAVALYAPLDEATIAGAGPAAAYLRRARDAGVRSAIVAPLHARGHTLGVVVFGQTRTGRRYGPGDVRIAQKLADRTAVALDNAELFRSVREMGRLREEFVSIASHELRSPLANIVALSHRLDRRARGVIAGGPDETREETAMLVAEVRRMQRTLELFLGLARLDGGGFQPRIAPVDLGELLAREGRSFLERHPAATLTPASVDGPLTIETDEDRVREVVTNLLDNAAEHGGDHVTLTVRRAGDRVVIGVADNGPGIPADVRPRLFDRAFRQARLQGGHGGGLGLGLYVAKSLAQRLGGDLTFETHTRRGTRFDLTLPVDGRGGTGPHASTPLASALEDVPRVAHGVDEAGLAGGL